MLTAALVGVAGLVACGLPSAMGEANSLIVVAELRSTVVSSAPSVITILPRATPVAALRSPRSVSVESLPLPSSKLKEVRPTGVVSESVKPLETCWLLETICLTRNEYVPGCTVPVAAAVRILLSLLVASAD